MLRKVCMAVGAAALVFGTTSQAQAGTVLKIGTLAPADSAWGTEFKKWAEHVRQETNGDLTLDFQWNGVAGDEKRMIESVRSGQLDGAAVTAVGLSATGVMDVLAFQLPGMFPNWAKLDDGRNAVKDDLAGKFHANGFKVLGWGDVGAAKTMSINYEVRKPADLNGRHGYYLPGDPIAPKIFQTVGGVVSQQLSVPEIVAHLGKDLDFITVPPLAAEQLQWASKITHINTMTTAYGIGALVMSAPRHRGLTDAQRAAIDATGRKTGDRLTCKIRGLDGGAFARMKANKSAYEPNEDEKKEWRSKFQQVRDGLCGPVFDANFCRRIASAGGGPQVNCRELLADKSW